MISDLFLDAMIKNRGIFIGTIFACSLLCSYILNDSLILTGHGLEEANYMEPKSLTECRVMVGSRRVITQSKFINIATHILPFQHLYINIFETPSSFAHIEAGHVGSELFSKGRAWALVKQSDWEYRGRQWNIKTENCQSFIKCLRKNTLTYTSADVPYHFLWGPNSNSFIAWILSVCGITLETRWTYFPYTGIDYFKRNTTLTSNEPYLRLINNE